MRLKRVRILGFKTFADRTEFALEGAFVAVVGPNGCGKSNIVDAILWALGEGNARQLRATHSQDVIFNGSPHRRPMGQAEVTLTFDNEDGGLPIESAEVSLTRRLTRAGESEYLINKRPCRLRDLHDLLADSGLGRAGYAIVGQKEIDSALAASADDRRAWIDEAAGVQRYRARKTESTRRLTQAKEHLARVHDILRELEAQRAPLVAEAELARRYRQVQASLQSVEVGLLVQEIARANLELTDTDRKLQDSNRLAEAETELAKRSEAAAEAALREVAESETMLTAHRTNRDQLAAETARIEADLRVLAERQTALDAQAESLTTDAEGLAQRREEARSEFEFSSAEEVAETEALDQLRTELAGVGDEARALTLELRRTEEALEAGRAAHTRQLREAAERAQRDTRATLVRRELEGIAAGMPELQAGISEANATHAAALAEVEARTKKQKELEANLQALREREERDANAARQALSEKASLEGRKRGIEATLDAHEGLAQGSRAVLEAASRGLIPATYIPVGSAIDVDRDLALAIETALGASANDLICDHPEDAKAAIAWLKQHRAGRATFQPIPLMRPAEASPELRRILNDPGVIGRASEQVACGSRVRPVIDSLLGRIVLVESLEDALRLARTSGWSRMVTRDGEVVHSGGAVTGGQAGRPSYGLVQRRADLVEAEAALKALTERVHEHERVSAERAKSRESLLRAIQSQRTEVGDAQREANEARQFVNRLEDERKSAERERDRLERELQQLEAAPESSAGPVDLAALEAARDSAVHALAARSADVEQAESRLRERDTVRTKAVERRRTAERRLQIALDAEAQHSRRRESIGPERERLEMERSERLEAQKTASARRIEVEAALALADNSRQAAHMRATEATQAARAARMSAAALSDAAHQAELARSRAENRRATALARLADEYALTEGEANALHGDAPVPDDAAALVSRLRRELRGMGDVNLGAIEAFERLTERFEELEAQSRDIEDGMAQIELGIRELDKLTRERFLSTLTAMQAQFAEAFQRLFDGGEGGIALTNPDDVLESGIELLITLPGKRRQPLSLLSGGERSMAAMAFLFALLRVKPSPLVVLDEVDAPLDGRNVERFVAELNQLTDVTQFIVITHNPTTMTAAPTLLGVTMEQGVSLLLPARLPSPA